MRLMIIGGLEGQLIEASKIASKQGAKVFHTPSIDVALHSMRSGKGADLIMADVSIDIELLCKSLVAERICTAVVACGINCSPEVAAKAIKSGAVEYIPLPPQEELIAAVFAAVATPKNHEIVYKSESFIHVMDVVSRIADSSATVLITGNSGTGKELIARFIHQNSNRKENSLIALNCAAIPEHLLESELFGHDKGAFTGALEKRVGKFEEANHSTILLDEISEMDLRLQAKLLRVLQEREISRIGSNKVMKLDVRVISTSNRNLLEEVKAGRFREDLFYRLNVINVVLPDLRDRIEDIPILADHFMAKYAKINGITPKKFSNSAYDKLSNYEWPGNIRELENIVHRALLITRADLIDASDIELTPVKRKKHTTLDGTLEEIEKRAISNALKFYEKDHNAAASVLGISIATLRKKIKQYSNL